MKSTSETIVSFLTGDLADADARAFEEELLRGEHDGPDLAELSDLIVALREAAFLGILSISVSREEMERVRALGYDILESRLVPGVEHVGDLTGGFDLLFVEFEIDLTGVTRLDCEVCDHDGTPFKRGIDIPFVPGQRVISGFCARELAIVGGRHHPRGMITRFISVEPGGDRVVAEYRTRAIVPSEG